MPTRVKFTQARRETILTALRAGLSLRAAARQAGVTHPTVLRWLERGRISEPGGRYHEFFAAVWRLSHPDEGDAPVVPIGTGRRLDAETKARLEAFYARRMAELAASVGLTVEEFERRVHRGR